MDVAHVRQGDKKSKDSRIVRARLLLMVPNDIRRVIATKFAQLCNSEYMLGYLRIRTCYPCIYPLGIFTSISKKECVDYENMSRRRRNMMPVDYDGDMHEIPSAWCPVLAKNVCYVDELNDFGSFYDSDGDLNRITMWKYPKTTDERLTVIYEHTDRGKRHGDQFVLSVYRCHIDLACPCGAALGVFNRVVFTEKEKDALFGPFRQFWYFIIEKTDWIQ